MSYDYSGFTYGTLSKWREFIKTDFPGFNPPKDVKQQLAEIEEEIATRKFALLVKHDGQVVTELARWRPEQECLDKAEVLLGNFSLGGVTNEFTVEQVSP